MASLVNHVSLQILQTGSGVSRAGFGVPLIISHSASWAERTRSYNELSEVAVDFPVTTSPEYLQAQAIFSQKLRPASIKIGRASLQPTQQFVLVPVVADSFTYTVGYGGEGVTAGEITFTSDASATLAEICTGIQAALAGVASANFTAVDNATDVTITGDAAGDWFYIKVDPAQGALEQNHADPGIATDLTAIAAEDSDWYVLLTSFNSNAMVLAADAWVAADKKLYIFDVNDTESLTTAAGNSDTLDDIEALSRDSTAGSYHSKPEEFFSAAWSGRCLSRDPGSITWAKKTLVGITADDLTATHRSNLKARNANFYETVASRDVTSDGTTADGDFIDIRRGLDWLHDEISKSVFGTIVDAERIPYTDEGVAVLESALRASLRLAVDRGVIAEGFTTSVTKVADAQAADKAVRVYKKLKFKAVQQGAIHQTFIDGEVSI